MTPPLLAIFKRLPRKVANRLTMLLFAVLLPFEKLLHRYSLVGHTELLDAAAFPWVSTLERNWAQIRTELDDVLRHRNYIPNYLDLSEEARGLTGQNDWKSFFFYAYGVKVPSNCDRCPATAALLNQIEGMKSGFFSILLPGSRLKPHRGHFAGVLRYHLGLKIPDVKRCGLRVGNQIVHWEEGKSVIFDDTFEHEAWNDADDIRVVLFVDFARPLPPVLAAINNAMIWLVGRSSVVQPGIAKLREWERQHAALWTRTPTRN